MAVVEQNRLSPDAANNITVDSPLNIGTDSGAANAYNVTVTPAITVLRTGLLVNFIAVNANLGASTLEVCNLSAKALSHVDGKELIRDAIPAGHFCIAMYDGTKWLLLNPAKTGATAGANMAFLQTQY